MLVEKFKTNLARRFPAKQQKAILDVSLDRRGWKPRRSTSTSICM